MIDSNWNVMAHSDAREGKWRGNWRKEWVATLPRNMVHPTLLPLMCTPRLPVVDRTDAPCRFKWTRPFRGKKKSGFCACAVTVQTQSTSWRSFSYTRLQSSVFCYRSLYFTQNLFSPISIVNYVKYALFLMLFGTQLLLWGIRQFNLDHVHFVNTPKCPNSVICYI